MVDSLDTKEVLSIAEGISNFGILILIASVFLILSGSLMIACFRWFKSIMNKVMENSSSNMEDLLSETRAQNAMLSDLSEAFRPETILRLKNISSTYFDLATETVCRLIEKVRVENNIANHEATSVKVRNLLINLHEDRNSRFDSFTYRGNKLSELTSKKWIDWVYDVFIQELYNDQINPDRTHTNVKTVYEKIKIDFYHNLK